MERRNPKKTAKEKSDHQGSSQTSASKKQKKQSFSTLPKDYIAMVKDVFSKNFSKGLKALEQLREKPYFYIQGRIYPNEIILGVSLLYENEISGTTVYASADFDPQASAPSAETVLNALVDGAGAFYGNFLQDQDKKKLEQLASPKLSSFEEDVPFDWTSFDMNKIEIFLKVDRANPILDQKADVLLNKSSVGDSEGNQN